MHSTELKGAMNVSINKSDKCHDCSYLTVPDTCPILKMIHKTKMFLGVYECDKFQQREREPLIEKGSPEVEVDEPQNFTSARSA